MLKLCYAHKALNVGEGVIAHIIHLCKKSHRISVSARCSSDNRLYLTDSVVGKIADILKRVYYDVIKRDKKRELNKKREASSERIVALLLIKLLDLLVHFHLCGLIITSRILLSDSHFFRTETSLLNRFFLLAYAKRKQYQFNEYRKYKYRKKIVAVDYLTTHFKHPANRLVNNIHSVFPSQLFIGSFIVFLGVFLHTPLVFGYLFGRAPALFLGNGIIAPFPKGIAAKYSPYGKPESNEKASFLKCLNGIG